MFDKNEKPQRCSIDKEKTAEGDVFLAETEQQTKSFNHSLKTEKKNSNKNEKINTTSPMSMT